MKNQLKRGERYKISRTLCVELVDGEEIPLYDDNLGDTVEIVAHLSGDYYDVNNITKGYSQYVPSSILEKII